MKNQRIFPGIILLGVGVYFLLQQSGVAITPQFFSWPTLLMIAGFAFLAQSYAGGEHEAILPGTLLFGYGLYYHVLQSFPFWSNQAGSFVLILAIGCLLRWQKTRTGFFQAVLFLILAFFLILYDKFTADFGLLQNGVSFLWKFWPLILIAAGAIFLFKRKK